MGGDLNAYTTKQETVYYATVLKEDFARAADLLTDIVFHSTFPQTEIDKEVEVICDEIESYKDSPSEIIFDEFEAMMFPAQPLGRDILGKPTACVNTRLPMPCVLYVVITIQPTQPSMFMGMCLSRALSVP